MFVFQDEFISGFRMKFYSHKPRCEQPKHNEYKTFGGYFESRAKKIQHYPFLYSSTGVSFSTTVWLSVV